MERIAEDARTNGNKRALIVANEAVAGNELRESLISHLGEEIGEVFVVAPALTESGLKYMLGDVDAAVGPARERLERTVAELREAGIEATGEVGDSDPMMAISDEIHKFHPDQVLVVDKVGDNLRVLDVQETELEEEHHQGWEPSSNLPPLSPRQFGGILVAIVGTLLLAVLAGASPSAGRILIAMALALVNLAHVVGLFLFQSVGYEGIWSRFFARLSLIGTPVAVVVSLLIGLF